MILNFLDPSTALRFLAAAIAITLAPGPDNLMVLSIGLSKGRKAGIRFGLGCSAGSISHTILTTIGIGAIIQNSPTAFSCLAVCGGLYLMWMGVQSFRRHAVQTPIPSPDQTLAIHAPHGLFLKGFIANALNPKVILFFLAFLPGFLDYTRPDISIQTIQLGLLFGIETACIFSLIGFFAGTVGEWLSQKPQVGTWLDRLAGAVLILLGLYLLASGFGV